MIIKEKDYVKTIDDNLVAKLLYKDNLKKYFEYYKLDKYKNNYCYYD